MNYPEKKKNGIGDIDSLKNNKSHGEDQIVDEFIKCTIDIMCPIYRKLFDAV